MVPMVPLERWGGGQAFWQKKNQESREFKLAPAKHSCLAPDEEVCAFVTPWWQWWLGPKCEVTFLSAAEIFPVAGLCQGSVGAGAGCAQGDAVAGMLWGAPREKGNRGSP